MDKPFPAYEGDDLYVFVSYSHEDGTAVFKEIRWLQDQGVNVWDDEGISPGSEWTDELAKAIERCEQFLYFVSAAAVESENCRSEVRFALNHSKPLAAVYLEPTELPAGLELSIGLKQALLRYELPTPDYQRKLLRALGGNTTSATRQIQPAPADRSRKIRWSFSAVVVVLLIAAGWWYSSQHVVPEQSAPVAIRSIAVLPFVNMSSDAEQEYFSDGISAEILNRLAKLPNIKVIARTSSFQYKGQNLDVRSIGESLNVSHVLEGSVRKSGSRVRITAQLIETQEGAHIWSDSYDQDLADIFAVQDEIATSILSELRVYIQGPDLPIGGTRMPEAHEAYLMGGHLINQSRMEEALEHFVRAAELDPDYADAHAATAALLFTVSSMGLRPEEPVRIERALNRALASEPRHVEALALQAVLISSVEHDHQRAIDMLHELVTRAPHNPTVLRAYRRVLTTISRWDLIVQLDAHHLTVDPLSQFVLTEYTQALAMTGRWDEARQIAKKNRALGVTPAVVYIELDLAMGSGDLAAMPGLLAEAREVLPFLYIAEPAYYVAIGDDAAVARLIEEPRNLRRGGLVFQLTGDEAGWLRVQEERLEREPIATMWLLRPWNPQQESSIWPWNHFEESDGFQRLLQTVGLDDESVARLTVPPLPF